MDLSGSIPWMESVESSLDAYMDVGGRANQETEPNGDRENVGNIFFSGSFTYRM